MPDVKKESVANTAAPPVIPVTRRPPKLLNAEQLATLASQATTAAPRPKEYAAQKHKEKEDKLLKKFRITEKQTPKGKGRGRPKKSVDAGAAVQIVE